MDPGVVLLELQGLTEIEEMLIARDCPIICVYRKHGGQGTCFESSTRHPGIFD